jgi:hypothetical protein
MEEASVVVQMISKPPRVCVLYMWQGVEKPGYEMSEVMSYTGDRRYKHVEGKWG